ncbi:MAG: proliferating cell nuclear antigen (pcna) [Candidatus Aenigmatarchaeota archaeon]|nr:MAG: proliferating cell nuclear antigen (pcna) [Candidatus Aenigmarchaeota archaeon]
MFRMVMNNGDLLKKSIPIISEIIDEGIFKITQNGLSLLCPDRTMVAVVDLNIPSSAFDEFSVEGIQEIGLNMSSLVDVIKRIKSSDKVIIQSGKENRVLISLEGNGKRRFRLALLDIKTEKPPIDQLKFQGNIELKSELLEDAIADAEIIADSLVMQASPEMFRISTRGDTSSAELELKKGEEGLLAMTATGALRARYPLEYLKKMIKAAKLAEKTTLEFGSDYPMRLSFIDTDKISLKFILAPRVED